MRIITANVNGVRAAAKKGFFTWLASQAADYICLQETKAHQSQLTDPQFYPHGYHCFYHDAQKKGYSGVAIYSRVEPAKVVAGIGWPDIDAEGRYLEAQYPDFNLVSLYMQSGSSGEARQAIKFDFMARFLPYLQSRVAAGEALVICGDLNIVHRELDIKNWKSNQKNSGCLPEERAWLDQLFNEVGFVDAFRVVNQMAGQYTWWSNRGQAWANNVGWRIDYQIVTPGFKSRVQTASIYKAERFSDHAPLIIDYA